MENFALVAPKFSVLVASRKPSDALGRRPSFCPPLPPLPATSGRRRVGGVGSRPGFPVSAFGRWSRGNQDSEKSSAAELENIAIQATASTSSSGSELTTSTSTPPPVPPPSYIGSPLLWIGVGVGLSAIFQTVAARVKRYALQQAFKTMMDQAAPRDAQFNNSAFGSGTPFPFPVVPSSLENSSAPIPPLQVSSQPVQVDVQATEVKSTPVVEVESETKLQEPPKKQAFVDVSPEELWQSDGGFSKESIKASKTETQAEKVPSDGTAKSEESASSEQSQKRKSASFISVEMLEKMMEDPTVQKMVYPHLPEEMRNPTTFKWMMQNPLYRQQLQDMLDNMNEKGAWNDHLGSLSNFDLSSPEIKQQFDQIGLTPEEAISRIMANPDVAMAFQNPKIQAAIMDLSQNPLSITKYQNDKEIMDVFTKISELFPGVTGRL